jgi:hypothetical protein
MITRRIEYLLLCSLLIPAARHLEAQQQGDLGTQAPSAVTALEHLQLKQDKVTNCSDARTPVDWNGIAITYTDSGLELSGTTSQYRHWKAVVPATDVFTCEVWAGSPYKGASPSLFILNGSQDPEGYGAELTILAFDSTGLPVPWRAIGHFSSNKLGIVQVISPGDGNSALIVSTREGDRHDGFAYVHHLVEINAAGFTKINGSRLSSNWPIITGNLKSLSGTEHNESLSEPFAGQQKQTDPITLKSVAFPSPTAGVGGVTLSDGSQSMFPLIL